MEGDSGRQRYLAADLVIDMATCEVSRGDEALELVPLSYRLLIALLEHAPAVMSPEQLMTEVWEGRCVSPETVTQRVKLLREALGDDAADPRYVGLVRGQGYRWLTDCSVDDRAVGRRAVSYLPSPGIGYRQIAIAAAVGIALIALPALLFFVASPQSDALEAPVDPGWASTTVAPAAAPGAPAAGAPAPNWRRDGPGFSKAPASVGAGSPDSGQLAPDTAASLVERGHYFLQRRLDGDIGRALSSFQRAVQLDAGSAPALAGLASSLDLATKLGLSVDPRGDRRAAYEALRRALAIDPDLADAHVRYALMRCYEGDVETARIHLEQAVALAPDNPRVLGVFAGYLVFTGKLNAAADQQMRAARLAPSSVVATTNAATMLLAAGRTSEAEEFLVQLQGLRPDLEGPALEIASIRILERRPVEALERLLELPDSSAVLARRASAYHMLGRLGERDDAIRRLLEYDDPHALVLQGELQATLGNHRVEEWTLARLEQSYLTRAEHRPGVRDAVDTLILSPFIGSSHSLQELRVRFDELLGHEAMLVAGLNDSPGD